METPFLADSSIHVLTSASGFESSWYYDSEGLTTGAVSYFASALSSGLGLYGKPEADMNNNGEVTLEELRRYLSAAVPSSSVQLLSAQANTLTLPVATGRFAFPRALRVQLRRQPAGRRRPDARIFLYRNRRNRRAVPRGAAGRQRLGLAGRNHFPR